MSRQFSIEITTIFCSLY